MLMRGGICKWERGRGYLRKSELKSVGKKIKKKKKKKECKKQVGLNTSRDQGWGVYISPSCLDFILVMNVF